MMAQPDRAHYIPKTFKWTISQVKRNGELRAIKSRLQAGNPQARSGPQMWFVRPTYVVQKLGSFT